MEDRKQYEPLFPKNLNYLNERYEKFQQSLKAIDYELDYGPKDKGPNPAPSPTGTRIISPELRQKRMEYLEDTRERRVHGFKRGVQKQIGGLEEREQGTINARFDFETARNNFRDHSKGDLKELRDVPKQDKVSFDYMAANYFNKYQQPDKASIADEKENIDAWGDRFQNQLDYYRVNDGREIELESREPEFDR